MKHFVMAPLDYKRDVNIVPAYVRDAATHLAKVKGIPLEEAKAFVRKKLGPGGTHEIKSPEVLVLSKDTPGNRTQRVMTFDQYLQDAVADGNIVSPTLATYINPNVQKSLLGMYIEGNLKKRQTAKKEMFSAGQEASFCKSKGDEEGYIKFSALEKVKDSEQSSTKIKNNSLSGAHSSPHTILYNKSSHSTLTSSCRSATSLGNANNEKFLYGNRHYWSPEIVQANIISIINTVDLNKLDNCIKKYGIVYPTAEQLIECVEYSSDLYWRNEPAKQRIRHLISTLNDIERAAVMYAGDFYHLAKYNHAVCYKFLDRMSSRSFEPITVEEAGQFIGKMDDDLKAFVSMLCARELDGRSIKKVLEEEPESYLVMGATARYIPQVLDEYEDFIQALWVTNTVPASVANVPTMIRRCAIASDTDSTIFTTQHWTTWFVGKLDFSPKSNAIASTMVYLASQGIRHMLAKMSANMGVTGENLHRLAMKNEYTFPVFGLTGRAKHYFAYMSAREGNMFKEMDKEIKGVALRSSNVPPHVNKAAHKMITDTMDSIIAGTPLEARAILGKIADMENDISDSILSGKYNYLTRGQIRDQDSYTNPESSVFAYYKMWEDVFAPKYGHTEAPPYAAIKVSVKADNPSKCEAWLQSFEDRELAARMRKWLDEVGRKQITTMYLPENVVSQVGVPKEVISGINIRQLIATTIDPFYLFLESLNLQFKNSAVTRLVSDKLTILQEGKMVPEPETFEDDEALTA